MATNDYTFDESAYLNYTGDNIWNAVYTIQLGELIENGIFDWDDDLINWADAAYSLEQYKRVCNYFIERFKFREISIVPYYEWGTRLHMKLVYELMPKYRMMYQFLDNRFDIAQEGSTETVSSLKAFTDAKRDLGNSRGITSARELANVRAINVARDLGNVATGNETRGLQRTRTIDVDRGLQSTRTIDENQDTGSAKLTDTTENGQTDTTGTSNTKTDEYSKSREIGSGYPETLLSANADYVSTGNDKEGETVETSDTDTTGHETTVKTTNVVENFNENVAKQTTDKLTENEATDTTDKLTENEQTDTTDKLNETETTKTDDTDTEAENSRVEDIFNEAETTLTNNDSSTRATVLTRGNLLDSYLRYAEEYQNIDKQLLDELEILFIGLYTMNTNAL